MTFIKSITTMFVLSMAAINASAMTVTLDESNQCSTGNAVNGIAVDDVTGNAGGASECWGTFVGNDSQVDNFIIDGISYEEIGKFDVDDAVVTGVDVSLPTNDGQSGTWSIDTNGLSSFLIALKAANDPGYAIWLFEGPDAASTFGTWTVAWGKDLSHMSLYSVDGVAPVPIPASGVLFLSSLFGIFALRRKAKAKAEA